jgi:hypothetical protein
MTQVIQLNVGGFLFVTGRDTLHSGFFLGLVESMEDHTKEVFIDRDPTHFRYILNWLRGCKCLPEDDQTLTELMWEADFYAMDDMVASITGTTRRLSMLQTLDAIAKSVGR